MEAVITINNLSKKFGRLEVLKNISLELRSGACVALTGPNGCGKTTLIKCILGMALPTKGDILFNGKSIRHQVEYRNHIDYMPQIGRYPENMNIGQVIAMIKNVRPGKKEYNEELIEEYGLHRAAGKKMRTLSGGTTQKVSAALAFLFGSEVLILDEPTAGLDPLAADILKEKIIREKQKGKLILITSHLLGELDGLINEVIFLHDGSLMFHKSISQLQAETGESKISKAILAIMKQQHA